MQVVQVILPFVRLVPGSAARVSIDDAALPPNSAVVEVVKDGLGPRGVEFVKVAMQPGMPQGSGRVGGVPVVCLPGNPVSALVSFEVFVRPALRAAFGHPLPSRPVVQAALTEALTPLPGKRQWRRGQLDRTTGTVTPWGPAPRWCWSSPTNPRPPS